MSDKLEVYVIGAELDRSIMINEPLSPYFKASVNSSSMTSEYAKDGGFTPMWNKKFSISFYNTDTKFMIQIFHRNMFVYSFNKAWNI